MAAGKEHSRFYFFYRSSHFCSQWHPCYFEIDGAEFTSAEQYMMFAKAKLFGDEETAAKILQTSNPRTQKALGRQVSNFDNDVWEQNCKEIVYRGNMAKFSQNAALKTKLLTQTQGKRLVEASPTDTIWGIGLAEDDPRAKDESKWRGKNYLGDVLTRVRDDLAQEESG